MIIFVYIYFIIISSFFSWFIHVGGCRSSYAWHGICAIESHFFSHPLYICVYLALFFLPVQTYNTHTHKHLICYSTHTHTQLACIFLFLLPNSPFSSCKNDVISSHRRRCCKRGYMKFHSILSHFFFWIHSLLKINITPKFHSIQSSSVSQ